MSLRDATLTKLPTMNTSNIGDSMEARNGRQTPSCPRNDAAIIGDNGEREKAMKVAVKIARILLGLIFFVFGLNGFLHFIPMQPMAGGAGAFLGALAATGYMFPILFAAQVVSGVLLLAGVCVPLALTILAPAPQGLPLAIIVVILELWLAWSYREKFLPLFSS